MQRQPAIAEQAGLARLAGVEPTTVRLEGGCSIQLSYKRNHQNNIYMGRKNRFYSLSILRRVETPVQAAEKRVVPLKKTRALNIGRNSASETCYARFPVSGKLVWRSLETQAFTTAKTKGRVSSKPSSSWLQLGMAKIAPPQATKAYLERDARNPALKETSRQYRASSADSIGRCFPRGTVVKLRQP